MIIKIEKVRLPMNILNGVTTKKYNPTISNFDFNVIVDGISGLLYFIFENKKFTVHSIQDLKLI